MGNDNGAIIEPEDEIKLLIDERTYNLLSKQGERSHIQINRYFDYPDFSITEKGFFAIRIREKNGKNQLCVKLKGNCENNRISNTEYNLYVDATAKDEYVANGIPPMVINTLTGQTLLTSKVFCFGELATKRTIIPLAENAMVELDKNDYLGYTDYELEFEIKFAQAQSIFEAWLISNGITGKGSKPKIVRFLDRLKKM